MLTFVRKIFYSHGITDEPRRLSGGWTNCVYEAGGWVLRCTENTENARLLREAQLVQLLPEEIGYPEMADYGSTDGFAWMLCRKVPGTNLENAWSTLSWDERADALEQLWTRAKHVHTLDAAKVRPFANKNLWYISTLENAIHEADSLYARKILTADQSAAVKGYFRRFDTALMQARWMPVHGDLTPANAMWHEEKIISLLDFECAVIAPKEADLMMLLNTAYERSDLPRAAHEPEAEHRFNDRMRKLVQAENPDWDILQGYEAIKLMHHVFMDMDDDDFSPMHEELVSLLALLENGKGAFSPVLP